MYLVSLKHRTPGQTLFGRQRVRALILPSISVRALGKPYIADNDEARRVSVDYTLAAAKAFTEQRHTAAKDGRKRKFRFVYVSGMAAQRDQTRSLWFMSGFRKIRVRGHPPALVQTDDKEKSCD